MKPSVTGCVSSASGQKTCKYRGQWYPQACKLPFEYCGIVVRPTYLVSQNRVTEVANWFLRQKEKKKKGGWKKLYWALKNLLSRLVGMVVVFWPMKISTCSHQSALLVPAWLICWYIFLWETCCHGYMSIDISQIWVYSFFFHNECYWQCKNIL